MLSLFAEQADFGRRVGSHIPIFGLGQLAKVERFVRLDEQEAAFGRRFEKTIQQSDNLFQPLFVECVRGTNKDGPRRIQLAFLPRLASCEPKETSSRE